MRLRHYLPLCLLVLTIAVRASAQASEPMTPSPQPPAPFATNITHIPPLTEMAKARVVLQTKLLSMKQEMGTVLNRNQSCLTMRNYGFTAEDLKSSTPKPSTYTTCTTVSANSLKDATLRVSR